MISRRLLTILLAAAAILLVLLALLFPLSMLLGSLGDAEGARWVRGAAVASFVLLGVDLTCLLLALGVRAADDVNESFRDDQREDGGGHPSP